MAVFRQEEGTGIVMTVTLCGSQSPWCGLATDVCHGALLTRCVNLLGPLGVSVCISDLASISRFNSLE